MTAERSAKRTDAGRIHNFRATRNCGNGHATAERLGHGDQVRLNSEMFAGKPFSSTRKAGLYFIGNEENPVLAANFLEKREVIFWRHDKPAFAQNRFGDDRSDGFRCYAALKCIFKMMRECLRGRAIPTAIGIGKGNAIHVADEWLEPCLIRMRFACERHGQQSAAVKSVFKGNHTRGL